MHYRIIKGSGGKQSVSFTCPACQDVLRTPLESAGMPVDCPTCKQGLICPGVEEWESLQASKRAAGEALSRVRAKEIEDRVAEQSRRNPAEVPPAASKPAATLVDYRPPSPGGRAPAYRGLVIASVVLRVYAFVLYLIAAVAFGLGVYSMVQNGNTNTLVSQGLAPAFSLMPGVVVFFGAAMAHGFSAGLEALRDMAINSYR